jgi:O-antigen ligase
LIAGRLDLTDWSSRQRLLVLLTAIDGIIRNPLTGYGPGAFESMLPAIARTGLVDDVRMPHNLFLHVWFELGLAAPLVLLVLLAGYYRSALRAYRRSHDVVVAGLIGGVSSMLCASMFGTLFIRGIQEAFLFLVAMTAFAVVATNEAYPRVREST